MKKHLYLLIFLFTCTSSAGVYHRDSSVDHPDANTGGIGLIKGSTGGITGIAGQSVIGTGGAISTGGFGPLGGSVGSTGGRPGSGGTIGSGGKVSTGGVISTGGITNTGGMAGLGGINPMPTVQVTIMNTCTEVPNISYALFNETTKETFKSNTFKCSVGDMICFGALGSDQITTWGVGITNNTTCNNCCFTCSQTSINKTANLSCKECK